MKKLLSVLLVAVLLAGCAGKVPGVQKNIFAMNTVMDLQLWGREAQMAADQVEQLLKELEGQWSATREDSLLWAINRGEARKLTAEQQALLAQVEALRVRTGGAFDPRLGALSEIWGFRDQNYRLPSQEEIRQALAAEQMDLGGALKGYAADRAVELMEKLEVERAILNLGGNIQTYGEKPGGELWQIAIQDPNGGALGVLRVEGTQSIVTSGSYQRYFQQDGKLYHHIMDASTGCPAESGLVSVTVICRNGLTADAISTALFVMGLEKGAAFWRESSDFEAVFVQADGQIYATQGANLTGCEYKEIRK